MSVPLEAYRNKSLFGVNGSGAIQHLRAILQVSDAYMKETFFLDELFPCVDEAGNLGIVGIVYPGTLNYGKHNEAQHGSLRMAPNGIFLNDCLSTKGDASQPVGVVKRTDGAAVWSAFKSAYYHDSSNYGFEWNIVSVTPQSGTINIGTLGAGEVEDESNIIPVPFNEATITAGDAVNIRAFITNPEGTYYSPYEFFYLVKFTATWRSPTSGPTDRPYQGCLFMDGLEHDVFAASETIYEGLEVWNDDSMTEPAPNGSYSYDVYNVGLEAFILEYFYIVNGVVVALKRCPDVIYIDIFGKINGTGSAKTFQISVQASSPANTRQLISGVVKIVTAGPTNNLYNFTVDMEAYNEDVQLFSVYDPVTGDPLVLMGVQSIEVISVDLQYDYYEQTDPYDSEMVYFANYY